MAKSRHPPTEDKKKLGRPRKYATAASLQKKVDAYLNSLKPDKDQPRRVPPTLSGLAVFLDFADFSTFKDYEANPDFSHVLKKAKMRITAAHEVQLFSQAAPARYSGSSTIAGTCSEKARYRLSIAAASSSCRSRRPMKTNGMLTTQPIEWRTREKCLKAFLVQENKPDVEAHWAEFRPLYR